MALEAPNPEDVTEYQFKLHDKLQIFEPGDAFKSDINLLATSSSLGLVFFGNPFKNEIRVIQLQRFIDAKDTGEDVLGRVVALHGTPHNLACSCDGSHLAVNYTQNGTALVTIYEASSFLSAHISIINVLQISADSNVQAAQILWNPVVANTFAVVLNNGAVSVYNLKDRAFELFTLDKQEQAKCACWSPKGKQLVIGFPKGKLAQYKPDLKLARTITCPPNIHNDGLSTIAIQWLSTYQFAAVFLQHGEDMSPSLYIINAPKAGQPVYINYYDICYSSSGPRNAQAFLTHIQPWNILLMATSNSMEVGVLGTSESGDSPAWKQYVTPDEARIELPLTADKQETYPIGFALETGTTHQLVIAERMIPVMPMVHILSTHGLLVSFNFLNFSPNAPGLCSPPRPIANSSGLDQFKPLTAGSFVVENRSSQKNVQLNSEVSFTIPSGATSTPAQERKAKPAFGDTGNLTGTSLSDQIQGTAFGSVASVKPVPTMGTHFGGQTSLTSNSQSAFGGQILNQKPAALTFGGPFFTSSALTDTQKPPQPEANKVETSKAPSIGAQNQNATKSQPLYTVPSSFTTTQPTPSSKESSEHTTPATSATDHDAVKELTKAYIRKFETELRELSKRSKNIDISIGNMDESKQVVMQLNELEELSNQAIESTDSLATDIQGLRNSLNECFVMLTETKSKLNMFENPDLNELAALSNTNQTNRRQIIKLKSFLATNEAQLQMVSQQIDAQWSNYQDMFRKSKTKMKIPSLEGIYQTMLKQKDILARERMKINLIKSRLGVKGVRDLREAKRNDVSIESLADSILSMSLSEQVKADRACLTETKQKSLRSILQNRKVVEIKPQRPIRVGLNSDVVREMRFKMEKVENSRDGAATKPEKMEKQRIKATAPQVIAKPTPTKPTPVHATAQGFSAISHQQKIQERPQVVHTKSPSTSDKTDTTKIATVGQVPKETALSTSSIASGGFSFAGVTLQKSSSSKPTLAFGGNTLPKPTAQLPFSAIQKESSLPMFGPKDEKPFASAASSLNSDDANTTKSASIAGLSKTFSTDQSVKNLPAFGIQSDVKQSALFEKSNIAKNDANILDPETEEVRKDTVVEKALPFGTTNLSLSSGVGGGFSFVGNTKPTGNIFGGQNNLAKPSPSIFGVQAASPSVTSSQTAASTTVTSFLSPSTGFASLSLGLGQTSTASAPPTTTSPFSFVNNATSESAGQATSTLAKFSFVGQAEGTASKDTSAPVSSNEIASSIQSITPPASDGSTISAFSFTSLAKNLGSGLTTHATMTTSSDPTDSLVDALNICKPSSKETSSSAVTTLSSSAPVFTSLAFASTINSETKPTIGTLNSQAPPLFSSSFSTVSASPITNTSVSSASPLDLKVSTASSTSAFGASSIAQTTVAAISNLVPTIETTTVQKFGSVSVATTSSSAFGNTNAPTSAFVATPAALGTPSSTFGSAASTFSFTAGHVFGSGMPKPDQSVFSGTGTATGASATAFGGASETTSPFESSPTSQPASGGNLFGSTGGAIGFGMQTTSTGSIFGGASPPPQPQQPGAFGSGTNTTQSAFGGQTQPTQTSGVGFFAQSSFGGDSGQTSGSIFGGSPNANPIQSSAFSSTSAFGQSPFQQQQPQQATSPFSSNNQSFGGSFVTGSGLGQTTGFGQSSPVGSFAQGGQPSVAQSGFGSPGFPKPTFGGPATFGSTPSFGAPASFAAPAAFGANSSFGSPKVSFGGFGQNTGSFSPPAQKNNLFESLGSSDSGLSFSNLAQSTNNAGNDNQQFGGTSFSTWR